MAYRQLFAVTFAAVGLCLSACSGGPAGPTDIGTGAGTEQPPASGETAPGTGDQPPGNPDQPPGNPDQPPGNPDQPPKGGGEPVTPPSGGPCDQLCDVYGDGACPGANQVNIIVRALCQQGCDSIKPACAAVYTTAINCVAGLPGLCTEAGPSPTDAAGCGAAYQAANECDSDED